MTAPSGVFVVASVLEITRPDEIMQATRQLLAKRLDIERLVAELSAQFINLPREQVDDAIRAALRRIGEALDIDRCNFLGCTLTAC